MATDPQRWQRLEELFEAALDLPPDLQSAFVERETADDSELRRELRALLDHDSAAAGRIGGAIADVVQSAAPGVDWTGQHFGPYRIVREIGRGGMGIVFEAVRDDDQYRKTVALKIAPWWRDPELLQERFRHERQILAGLEHPNIARFLDGGARGDIPYLAMEFVKGCTLSEYCARNGLKLREKIALFRQVCAAVHYAHQSLVIHRDLKPGNILVDQTGTPKLLDFGVAKLLSVDPDGQSGALTGAFFWTPDYASPEQIRGAPVTTLTDVYSLGLILYELFTGERAQKADNASPLALDRSICETQLPLPSTRCPRVIKRQLSGDLDTIVGKATHKDPARRYDSAASLSEDLGRYLNGRPVAARHDSASYRVIKFLRRNWLPVSAALAIAFSLLAGAVGFASQARLAERRFNQVRKLATVFLFDVNDQVANMPGATAVREMVTRTAVDSLAGLAADAGNNYPLRRELAAAYLRLGTVQGSPTGSNLGRMQEGLVSFERGLGLLKSLPAAEAGKAEATEAGLLENHGRILMNLGRLGDAETDLKRSAQLLSRECRDVSKDALACTARLSVLAALLDVDARLGRVDASEQLIREYDQTREAMRSVLRPVAYQTQSVLSRIFRARVQFQRYGPESEAETLHSALPVAYELVSANPNDVQILRLGTNVCLFYGDAVLQAHKGIPTVETEAVIRHGVEWSEQLVKLDANDRRSKKQAAQALAQWGETVARSDPAGGVVILRRAVAKFADELQRTPKDVDWIALTVDFSQKLMDLDVMLGHEETARNDIRLVLDYYDPLAMAGLPMPRSDAVRDLQARVWVAGSAQAAGKSGGTWYNNAAQQAIADLAQSPSDVALQVVAMQLFDVLPGDAAARAAWRERSEDLRKALAPRFPNAEFLTSKSPAVRAHDPRAGKPATGTK
jgi:serine/threonine protein kinase